MAKKQTRRSISISGDTHAKLRIYCEVNECSMSGLVEGFLKELLGKQPSNGARLKKIKELAEAKENFSF
jgi:hypothetical protein